MMLRYRMITVQPRLLRCVSTSQTNTCTNNSQKQKCSSARSDDSKSSNITYSPPRRPITQLFTHQIQNQVPPIVSVDLYASDLALQDFFTSENNAQIKEMAKELGTYHWFEQGDRANRNTPVLQQFDRYGQRIDEVQFHPAYHDLMQIGMRYGVSSKFLYQFNCLKIACRNDSDCPR